jgi:hypothetical protein
MVRNFSECELLHTGSLEAALSFALLKGSPTMKKLILAVILALAVLGGTAALVSAGHRVQPASAYPDVSGSDGEMPVPGL